jgi:hypothetical protein
MDKLKMLVLSLLLAGTLAGAQDTLGSGAKSGAQEPASPPASQSSTAQNPGTVIRGCLTGSPGNFTLTDQNGMQYKLMGGDNLLQSKIGHEIEVTGTGNQASEASGRDAQESTAPGPNGVQVSDVRDVSGSCRLGREGSSQPLSGRQPDKSPDGIRSHMVTVLQE